MADDESLRPRLNAGDPIPASETPADLSSAQGAGMDGEGMDADLVELEMSLARLRPVRSDMDRDELMFLAGRQDALRVSRRWFWPSATILSTTLAASLAVMLLLQNGTLRVRAPQVVTPAGSAPVKMKDHKSIPGGGLASIRSTDTMPAQVPPAVAPAPTSTTSPRVATTTYLKQRSQAIAQGVDALPGPSSATSIATPIDPIGYGAMRERIIGPTVERPPYGLQRNPTFSPLELLPF